MKHSINQSFIHTIILSIVLSSSLFAQFQLPKYENYILENGLTLYLMEQHEVPLIYISAIFPAGAVWDETKSGLAAFTADALLFGTKIIRKNKLRKRLIFLVLISHQVPGKKPLKLQYHLRKVILTKSFRYLLM